MKIISKTIGLAWLAVLVGTAPAQEVGTLLTDADRYRMPSDNLQVDTQITVFNSDGTPDKERLYRVFAQAKRQSLVLMQSPAEKGQKVLMLGDDFWLLMPNSQRPMRITPMQKLLGDAATGDIASLRWAQDYTGAVVGEERCEASTAGALAQTCWHLSLTAARKGVSYQRIELWLGRARHEPIKADLYVQSEKLAKQASFVMDQPSAPTRVMEMVLQDQLSHHKQTRVRYLARQNRVLPEAWLNPMFLAKNAVLE